MRAKDATLGYLAQGVADETQATLQQLVDAALERAPHEEWGLRNKMLRAMLVAFGFSEAEFAAAVALVLRRPACQGGARTFVDRRARLPNSRRADQPSRYRYGALARVLHRERQTRIHHHSRAIRYFLDRVTDRIWELENGRFHTYAPAKAPLLPPFSRRRKRGSSASAWFTERYITDREKRRTTIAGLRATHTSSDYSQVRSREKQLARVEAASAAPPPAPPRRSIGVRLASSRRATNGFAFETKGLAKAYARPLFDHLTVSGSRKASDFAIVGPNGAGKSTLLKILAEQLAPDRGTLRYNPAAGIAYFAQSSLDQLDLSKSAVEAVLAAAPVSEERARGLLGRMLLGGEAADKSVSDFSGGERRRIMLACLMARRADVLLLDEPTNDLDIDSREALESVLDEYEGAIVVVSRRPLSAVTRLRTRPLDRRRSVGPRRWRL